MICILDKLALPMSLSFTSGHILSYARQHPNEETNNQTSKEASELTDITSNNDTMQIQYHLLTDRSLNNNSIPAQSHCPTHKQIPTPTRSHPTNKQQYDGNNLFRQIGLKPMSLSFRCGHPFPMRADTQTRERTNKQARKQAN